MSVHPLNVRVVFSFYYIVFVHTLVQIHTITSDDENTLLYHTLKYNRINVMIYNYMQLDPTAGLIAGRVKPKIIQFVVLLLC